MKTTVNHCLIAFLAAITLTTGTHAQVSKIGSIEMVRSPASGIGVEDGVMRRDPSDVIKIGDLYYVWYSKGKISPGYDATVWYATSPDGRDWTEKGMAIAKGEPGSWEGESVFTPNILVAEGRYWLFYTGVSKKFGKNYNPDSKIGIAVSDSPDGPWERLASNPVLKNSDNREDFDSHLVDDACLIVREGKYWFYYKGRQQGKSPAQTQMGLAIADQPQGPYVKVEGNPVIPGNHEVLVWPQGKGVAAMIGTTGPKNITNTIQYAADGLHFSKTHDVVNGPVAGGVYRPEAFTQSGSGDIPVWGVHIGKKGRSLPFIERFDLKVAEQQNSPYDGSWESLQKMPVPAWFDDGKIGIFIHWGPYSAIGYKKGGAGYAEHVPKLLYEDSDHYYPYMKQRWGGNPPEFGYKDIIPEFKAENWDPDQWATLFAEVGARYVVLTAEHHDGWANWESDLTPWNAVEMGPQRDLVGDLGRAIRKRGLKYAPSFHRERHTGFFAKEKYVVHSEPRPDVAEEIRRVPEAALLYGPFSYSKDFVDDYVARWKEIQTKYQPDFLWVDDFPILTRDGNLALAGQMKPEVQYFYDQVRGMITDFMNDAAARGQAVYVNNKGGNRNWPEGVGCLEKDNLKLKVIGPKWESCTTFGTSFGYLAAEEDPDYKRKKSVEDVIHEMIEVISRNGNFLINIGPKADGTIPGWQVERLRAMGDWLKINGDAIYGSRYWRVYAQQDEHLAFTTKGKTLYAIKMDRPTTPFVIDATAGWNKAQVKSVRLIGSNAAVSWDMTPEGLRITPPGDLGHSMFAWSFEIVTGEEQHHPSAIEADADKSLRGTTKVNLEGNVGPKTLQ